MSDFDTQRLGEILELEQRSMVASQRALEYQALADKWTPKFSSSIDNDTARISIVYGGKTATVKYPVQNLQGVDVTSATTSMLQSLFDSLISDVLRPLAEPQARKMVDAANSMTQVSKW